MNTENFALLMGLSALASLLPVDPLECPLQGTTSVALCPMCSQNNAAVRWTARAPVFGSFSLKYECSENGAVVFSQSGDTCFERRPIVVQSTELRTGVSSIGYRLWAGLECKFTAQYYTDNGYTETERCTILTADNCTANPEECHVDRVSEIKGKVCHFACAEGYQGDRCNNIDECKGNNTCDDNADCHDTDGSYWCQCRPGFHGDGYNCTDIDECANMTCLGENSECVNNEGNFSCDCMPEFTGDGYNCTAVCLNVICGENAECISGARSYSCQCLPGFTGDGDYCEDIDECLVEMHECSYFTCTNLPGTYKCDCLNGSSWNGSWCKLYNSSQIGPASVIAAVIGGATLLVLLLVIVVVTIKNRYKSRPLVFKELAEMELDPEYMPRFLNGSMTSIQSAYETLYPSNEDKRSGQDDVESIDIMIQVSGLPCQAVVSTEQTHAQPREKDTTAILMAKLEATMQEMGRAGVPSQTQTFKAEAGTNSIGQDITATIAGDRDIGDNCGEGKGHSSPNFTCKSDQEGASRIDSACSEVQHCSSDQSSGSSVKFEAGDVLSSNCDIRQDLQVHSPEDNNSSSHGSYSSTELKDALDFMFLGTKNKPILLLAPGSGTMTPSTHPGAGTEEVADYSYAFQCADYCEPGAPLHTSMPRKEENVNAGSTMPLGAHQQIDYVNSMEDDSFFTEATFDIEP